jgi:beta-glucosidase
VWAVPCPRWPPAVAGGGRRLTNPGHRRRIPRHKAVIATKLIDVTDQSEHAAPSGSPAGLLIAATATAVVGAGPAAAADVRPAVHSLPYYDARLPVRARVADLLGRITLAEKIAR